MAKQTSAAKPAFYEVVFRGKPKVVRAFLHGLVLGAGADATIFFSYTDGIAHEGKLEQLAGKVGLRTSDCHVVMDAGVSALIKDLAKRIVAETGLEIAAHRRIRSAKLAFSYTAYTPGHEAELLQAVESLPPGVRMQGFTRDEKADPGARGVEAYAPSHDFEASGEGLLLGPVDELVAIRQRMARYPLIAAKDIELVLA
ncbi:MAG: hypothetical protein IH621_00665 [Krumholzibacteria bacterium]|nr:hypothetical protein [Candidatus Krumholzibacteria bacterium]